MTDELLGKYIAGEANADEQARVRRWLSEHPDHPAELARFERIWRAAGDQSAQQAQPLFDTNKAWQNVRAKMHQPDAQQPADVRPLARPPIHEQRPRWIGWARVSATVLLVGALSLLTYRTFQNPDVSDKTSTLLTQTTASATQRLTLPDGSTVLLNRRSSLRYPDSFSGQTREVVLIGEAFFDINPNAKQPFIIHAQGTDVRVVGTSFGVRAYNQNVRVSVKTGKVMVRRKQQEVALIPGQQATIDPSADTLRRLTGFDPNALAFSTRRLAFTNQPLSRVVATLSEYYQTDINLEASRLQNCRLTAQFDNESVETVLGIVAETLQLNVKRTQKGFVLTGEGCNSMNSEQPTTNN